MRFLVVLAVLFVPTCLLPAAPPEETPAEGPKLARVVFTGTYQGGGRSSIFYGGGGKAVSIDITTGILKLDEKATLLVVINHDKVMDKKLELDSGKAYAISGRLAVEGPGVQTGMFRIRTEGMLTVKGDKAVVLLADAVTPIDEKNKNLFPAAGKVTIEGTGVCGKRDLKLTEDQTLAVKNSAVAIILSGEKARPDAAGKGMIRATGTVIVDDKGLIRLKADEVETGLKPSAEFLAEDAIEAVGGSYQKGEAPNRTVRSVSLALPAVTDAQLAHLRAFPNLEELDLSGAKVTDEGMKLLREQKSIRTLSLAQTEVTDSGLAHLKGLTKLKTLNLLGVPVTDVGLAHLKELAELETLDLSKTKVTFKGLEHLKGLGRLKAVTLDDAQVTDAMLDWLVREDRLHTLTRAHGAKGIPAASLNEIVSLSLSGTPLTDAGLSSLKGLTNLQTLYLRETPVTDAGLAHLKGLANLQMLYLGKTKVQGSGLEHLKGLDKLQTVYLDDAQLTDEALAGLAKADKLHTLSNARGDKGTRPSSTAEITSLSLRGTPVTDAGLAHLKGLADLQTLYLNGAVVTDDGLAYLKGLTKLRSVYASGTKVTAQGATDLQTLIPGVKVSR